MEVTKNYNELGGAKTVIGGELDIVTGGKITANGVQAAAIASHADPATATSTDIATKQNQILAALRGAGIIA
jgi:glutamate-1-semialdehyde aminotransferase